MANKLLEPYSWSIDTLFKHFYNVPVYQRPYRWDVPQVKTLLEDILQAKDEGTDEGYFIGSMHMHDENKKVSNGEVSSYEIIDGQQRITTVSLIMLATYCILTKYKYDVSDGDYTDLKRRLWKYHDSSYHKDERAVELNSLEKECYKKLYNECFSEPENARDFAEKYIAPNRHEKTVLNNFMYIYDYLSERYPAENKVELLKFFIYVRDKVQVIAIESACSISKAFSIFESINSKGMSLDEIDKIKTYIFSEIETEKHDECLNLWGDLLLETDDHLSDYLYTFIRANINYYTNSIKIASFKKMVKNTLPEYYQTENRSDLLIKLLKDLQNNVKYYKALTSYEKAKEIINKKGEFRFYYYLFTYVKYDHPKPLFFRCLTEVEKGTLDKDTAAQIMVEAVKFSFLFKTVLQKDSKTLIKPFKTIMNDIFARKQINEKVIINVFASRYADNPNFTNDIKKEIKDIECYQTNKSVSLTLISLYESFNSENKKISYDNAYNLISQYGSVFALDHILVQTPDKDPEKNKYKYCSSSDNPPKLKLLPGSDFPNDIKDGMDYEEFKRKILHHIGNLRLFWGDENGTRSNSEITLNDYGNFTKYSQVKQRETDIANIVFESALTIPKYSNDQNLKPLNLNDEAKLPKISDLIAKNILQKEMKLYVLDHEEDIAELKNGSKVVFEGQSISFHDWVSRYVDECEANEVFEYIAVVGSDETLEEIRKKEAKA